MGAEQSVPVKGGPQADGTVRWLVKDGNPVFMPGIFKLYDTHGLPFCFSLQMTFDRGMFPDWVDLVRSAKSAGWSEKKIKTTVGEALRDLFEPGHPINYKFAAFVTEYFELSA